jgi:hypothetical protein
VAVPCLGVRSPEFLEIFSLLVVYCGNFFSLGGRNNAGCIRDLIRVERFGDRIPVRKKVSYPSRSTPRLTQPLVQG